MNIFTHEIPHVQINWVGFNITLMKIRIKNITAPSFNNNLMNNV